MAGNFIKLGRKRHAKRIAEERDRFNDDGKPRKPDPNRNAPGVPSNLTKYRFRGDVYTAAEEADELRRIRDGDKQALDRFAKHFQPLVRKILGDRKESYDGLSKAEIGKRIRARKAYFGMSEEDRIAVGNIGLARFIVEYDLKRNVRFATGLEEYIRGTFLDLMKGTTKADRALFAHPKVASAEELVKLAGYSTKSAKKLANALEHAEAALLKRDAAKSAGHYDTLKEGPSDGDDINPWHYAGHFDLFENQRVHQHRAITKVIELAVTLSEGRAKEFVEQYGLCVYAQRRVAEKASVTYTEVKRRRRMRDISPQRAYAWNAMAEFDATEHSTRQLPLQRSRQDREEREQTIRQQRQDLMDKKVAAGIKLYLDRRGR